MKLVALEKQTPVETAEKQCCGGAILLSGRAERWPTSRQKYPRDFISTKINWLE
jgi:hypothetical protein